MKPTEKELIERVWRGGRVFLFEFPESPFPDHDSLENIIDALLDIPGCTGVQGPLINGILAITVDDQHPQSQERTDEQWIAIIASVVARWWREENEVIADIEQTIADLQHKLARHDK